MLDDTDSDSVHDILVRGIAAAKAGSKDEARFLLEWALDQADASRSQRSEAWLWLSEVYDDPAKKRRCLEEVLGWDPANALARRGLAILEGRLRPEDIVDPRKPVEPVRAAPQVGAPQARRYMCPKCGGRMAYAPDRRALACASCGHRMWEFDAIQQGLLVQEQDFFATLPTARAHTWQLATVRTLTCQGCGASITLPPAHSTAGCPFCDSPHVVVAGESRELIEPEGVLPFALDADQALGHVRKWLAQQRFRPDDLAKRAAIDVPHGVYLPFWTFDVGGQVTWTAMVAEFETDWQGRQSVRWVKQESGEPVDHDDMLVAASRSLSPELLEELATGFDTTKGLVPYTPDVLAAWPAEIYQLPMADASLLARRRALDLARKEIEGHLNGLPGTARDLSLSSLGIAILSYKLVLLPVWIGGYGYKGQHHTLAINGQTGKVCGAVPRKGVQKVLAGLFGGS